ncbi:non-ribosomal peptide synthetase [Tumebacillus algifaecis]|nr:non-ribosomal peptide synthetase [Tumebacillus algifaecis]
MTNVPGQEYLTESEEQTDSEVYVFPASFAQQRLWILEQWMQGSTVYTMPFVVRLEGRLHLDAWIDSFREIQARHETLRTTFEMEDGQLMQVVAPSAPFDFQIENVMGMSENEQEQQVQKYVAEQLEMPFDLESGPLWRASLIRLKEESNLFVLTMHHIISDGWSIGVLLNELAVLYEAFVHDRPSPLPELEIQYVDYTLWQQESLTDEVLEKQLSYWREQLGSEAPALQLLTDRPRPAVQTHAGAAVSFLVEEELFTDLQALSTQSGTTLYMTLLAAFQALLHRYSGQEEVRVGTPIAGRDRKETAGLIGFFVNTLVMNADFSDDPTFLDLLARVRQTVLGAFAHQNVPFEKLVEELRPDRDASRTPLFQTMFSLQTAPVGELKLSGLTIIPLDFDFKIAKFDLNVTMTEYDNTLGGTIEYNTDLFDAATIERMIDHLKTLLKAITRAPQTNISKLPLLTNEERQHLLAVGNRMAVYERTTIVELFEAQVSRLKDRIAISQEGIELTYEELNSRANRLARRLQQHHTGPNVIIGICAERTIEMIVGLIAILKTGSAYLPLDPSHPVERITSTIEDAQISTLVTHQHLLATLPEQNVKTILFEAADEEQSEQNLGISISPDHLAYVIYTSGSTGKPKGALLTHYNVARLFDRQQFWFDCDEQDVWTLFHSFAFDFSVWEMWGALLFGGKLVIVPHWISRSPHAFFQLLVEEKVTMLSQTPSAFRQLIQAEQEMKTAGDLSLRQVFFGGERLDYEILRPWFDRHGDRSPQLTNLYGITETTVHATYRPLRKEDLEQTAGSVIGRPLSDTRIYVLDDHLQPVPIGLPGELYIGGAGVGLGYLNRAELTQERFIRDPFCADRSEILYRSGDAARLLPTGELEYLGRLDTQVKIRGFRIELGEITSVINQHPDVLESTVIVREDQPGDLRIAAYVVMQPSAQLDVQNLLSFVKIRIPAYMVPSAFVALDQFPLTPNGKVDRRALPAPDANLLRMQRQFVAPSTSIERALTDIWSEVLNIEEIGVSDNFFDLGGHSLLATQVSARLGQQLHLQLPLRDLFEKPTIAELAAHIERLQEGGKRAGESPVEQIPVRSQDAELPLSFAQQRLWLLDQLQDETTAYSMPFALKLSGKLHVDKLFQSLWEMIERHEVLRTRFAEVNDAPIQVIDPPSRTPFTVVDLRGLPSQQQLIERDRLLQAEANTPFDLKAGPLFRCSLLHVEEAEWVLLLNMHHAISDGWSISIFVEEMTTLYKSFTAGKGSPLSPLSIQFADYAIWQHNRLQQGVLAEQMSYWKERLSGELPVLQLPTDYPITTGETTGDYEDLQLTVELTARLHELSKRSGATMFMTVVSALQLLLSRHTGQDDLMIGSPIAGRHHQQTEGLIGLFLNTLVLRSDLSGDPTFEELLGRVRETTLSAYANAEVPFEKLVEELQPERHLYRNPLFDVLINYQNTPQAVIELDSLTIQTLETTEQETKFWLSLFLYEQNDSLQMRMLYRKSLFSSARVAEWMQQLVHLLEQVADDPAAQLSSYSLVTEKSRQLLPDPLQPLEKIAFQPVSDQFRSIAVSLPEQIAVRQGGRSHPYQELATRADSLADALLQMGIKRGDVVAVIGGRSFGLIATMLGVMISGGTLLLIDRALPEARRKSMLDQADVKFVCKLDKHICTTSESHMTLEVDPKTGEPLHPILQREGMILEVQPIAPSDPAYIFFTSGTTGTPKGVLGNHNGLSHFLLWQKDCFDIKPSDRMAQLIHLSFDPVLRDIFLPLISGATLCLPDQEEELGTDELLRWIEREQITVLNTVPSVASVWVTNPPPDVSLRTLRWLFTAGEPLSVALVTRLRETFPQMGNIVNLYGPTETTLAKCFYIVPEEPTQSIQPVGRALPQAQALVLNVRGQLCGIGEQGEVVIRTPYRTNGYLLDSADHTERFRPNHWTFDESDLLYYTGDIGRYRPDGALELLGRLDDQVKIRGVRIQLSEISSTLARHPAVQACAVLDWKEGERAQLAAYAVIQPETNVGERDLRAFLEQELPLAMVPNAFKLLDELPLTANGKVDRSRLPRPRTSDGASETFVAPRTPLEREIASIWSELLNVEQVGIHDHFFALGGHSLLATQMISRMRRSLKVEISLRSLFERPTVASFAALISAQVQTGLDERDWTIPIIERTEKLPLSYAQRRMWLLEQMTGSSPVYTIPILLEVDGALDVQVAERCLQVIVSRHESLRTLFRFESGDGVQIILPQLSIPLHLQKFQAEEQAMSWLQAESSQAFDLAEGPLLRAYAAVLSPEQQILMITMHHIISDIWSIHIFVQEFVELYRSFAEGQAANLPELSVQYADYAMWQTGHLEGSQLVEQLEYWKGQLAGELPVLQLPTDRPRPSTRTYRGGNVSFRVTGERKEALLSLGQEMGTSLYMTLLAVYKTLLYRYSGQDDILVGSPIAGRGREEIEHLIGFFVNTLVLRTDLSDDPTFAELLVRVKKIALDAFAHQDLPFDRLVQEVVTERNPSISPLFQTMFMLQNHPQNVSELQGLSFKRRELDADGAKFDLTLTFVEQPDGLYGTFEYNSDIFDASTIERMVQHLHVLLAAVSRDPDQPISQIDILPAEERHQLLSLWNQTQTEYPADKSIHQLFDEQVALTPDRVAVSFRDQHLTYLELNERANRLAAYLVRKGVDRQAFVGLSLERSLEMVIALLAILKAGGTYVPIDPHDPIERKASILQDAGVELVITNEKWTHDLSDRLTNPPRWICLDLDSSKIAAESAVHRSCDVPSESLAYLVYTSGSTGIPKGVAVSHRAVLRLVLNTEYVRFSSEEVFLQFAPIAFDASTFELWGSLLHGARLVLFPERRASLTELANVIRRERVSTMFLTTALFHQMVEEEAEAFREVRQLLVGGEVLSPAHLNKLRNRAPGCQFIHVYGPTESTTFATSYPVDQDFIGRTVPIGRPIANTTAYVLDSHLQPVPIGVQGELYIGGNGLAQGYLNRPDLTERAFLPHPFLGDREDRLYRTGDIVRYLPDGNLEFCGRVDHQIKIRGFRIEPGEIETVLSQHPALQEQIVIAREAAPGNKVLVAYVVLRDKELCTSQELREFLQERLPEQMIPHAFVLLDALPLTSNGKVDRKALPEPDWSVVGNSGYIAPATPLEEILCGIWSDVLQADSIGTQDDFFERGGHSLSATQVIARIKTAFGVEIPLRALFEAPTVAKLSEHLGHLGTAGAPTAPIQAHLRSDDRNLFPLSFAQQRLWVVDQLVADRSVYNIPFAVRLDGKLDLLALESVLNLIVLRHETLRTRIVERGGQPMQDVVPHRVRALPIIDLTHLSESEREDELLRLARQDRETAFDLRGEELLFRFSLLKMAKDDHVLLLNMHHIISDGWSISIFTSELTALYQAEIGGEKPALQELPIQYADFAVWQREQLQEAEMERQLTYWKKRLSGLNPLELPTDRARPSVQKQSGAVVHFNLSSDLSKGLHAISRRYGVTLYMTLLAGFQALLARYSGQDDISVGTPIAGRTHQQTESLIGFFLNTLVMRTEFDDSLTIAELLDRVREVTLGAYAHQDLPFERLVQEIQPDRDLSRTPLFQTMFLLQNMPRADIELPDLTLRTVQMDSEVAKFDLTLTMEERDDSIFGAMTYSTELFDESTVLRMISHLQILLQEIVNNQEQPISEIALVSEEDRQQLQSGWRAEVIDYGPDRCLHQLFEHQSKLTPDAPALMYRGERMTYRELNARANSLAHTLQQQGVGPEVIVGLCFERSFEMVIATLAVLKAGGAYLPLDPAYPQSRLAYMLSDAIPLLLLTQRSLKETLPPCDQNVWCLDDAPELWSGREEDLDCQASIDNLAYITYTSGSTGHPKGVLAEHRGAVNYLRYVQKTYGISIEDRVLQVASYSFDASVRDLLGPLLAGACVVLTPNEDAKHMPALLQHMSDHQITCVLSVVPTLLQALIQAKRESDASTDSLRLILVSGEVLYGSLVRQAYRSFGPQVQLVNQYGPTECTMTSTYQLLTTKEAERSTIVAGRPIPNSQLYVLDKSMQPVPIGVVGEVYIGGEGLSRGYLNLPEQTASAFLPNPFASAEGERIYRTGDLGRLLPDGALEFLGRKDQQVKLRGQRVELGEIQTSLLDHPQVRDAAVLLRESQLVAYLVVDPDHPFESGSIRRFLQQKLPDSIIPSAFLPLDALPLTSTGKLDRRALPEWKEVLEEQTREMIDPRSPFEEIVADIWKEVLGLERISMSDDFFELGGHSLLATRVVTRIEEALDIRLPLKRLFEKTTAEALANVIEDLLFSEIESADDDDEF